MKAVYIQSVELLQVVRQQRPRDKQVSVWLAGGQTPEYQRVDCMLRS